LLWNGLSPRTLTREPRQKQKDLTCRLVGGSAELRKDAPNRHAIRRSGRGER
jgi:hypothetical protein